MEYGRSSEKIEEEPLTNRSPLNRTDLTAPCLQSISFANLYSTSILLPRNNRDESSIAKFVLLIIISPRFVSYDNRKICREPVLLPLSLSLRAALSALETRNGYITGRFDGGERERDERKIKKRVLKTLHARFYSADELFRKRDAP